MALTNLNALGSAIRTKVGEAEKKTLPQLKDIVDNQLVYPQNELSVTTNGIYDVKSYASVNVTTDERTAQDYKNAVDIASWNALFSEGTGALSISSAMKTFTGEIPFIDASHYSTLSNAFLNAKAKSINIKFSEVNTDYGGAFYTMPNLERLEFSGSTRNATVFDRITSECPKLKAIDGEFDFTSATSLNHVFTGCTALERIRIKPNTINTDNIFYLTASNPNSTYLAVINGLNTVSTYHTTFWVSSLQRKFGATAGVEATLWCKEIDGIYVDCNKTDDGAISYASAITSKGWTIV